jgi:hypothetical protein
MISLIALVRFIFSITFYLICCGFLVNSILSHFYASYSILYIWTVSSIFKTGLIPSLLLLFYLLGFVILIVFLLSRSQYIAMVLSFTNDSMTSIASTSDTNARENADKPARINLDETSNISENSKCLSAVMCTRFLYFSLVIINIIVVVVVNGLYVYAVRSNFSANELLTLSFVIALFKIVWNNVFVLSSLDTIASRRRLTSSEQTKDSNDVSDNNFLVLINLFNNLLAPCLAELCISSDCFLYIITQAPQLVFSYHAYSCVQVDNAIQQFCNVNVETNANINSGTEVSFALIPPFHYSYQCSFAFVSNYVYVFIFRCTLSALIEPLLCWAVYTARGALLSGASEATFVRVWLVRWLTRMLPTVWKLSTSDHQKVEELALIESSLGSRSSEMASVTNGRFCRRLLMRLLMDFALLLALAPLFPPLAFIATFSILKDVLEVHLGLLHVKKCAAVCDSMLKERIQSIYNQIYKEANDAFQGLFALHGIKYTIIIATWIWAFVLFDTVSPFLGILKSLWIVLLIVLFPILVRCMLWLFRNNKFVSLFCGKMSQNANQGAVDIEIVNILQESSNN